MPLPQPTIRMGGVNRWGTKTGKILFQQYDEANKLYKPIPIDHSRNSGGWRINKNGLWERQPDNYPRIMFDSNPAGEYINEESIKHICWNSEKLSNWTASSVGTGITPVVQDNFNTYKGRPTSKVRFEVNDLDGSSRSFISNRLTSISDTTRLQSVYIRSLSESNCTLTVLGAGENETVVTPEWQQYSLSTNVGNLRIGIIDVGSNTQSQVAEVEIAMPMWEEKSDVTPGTYIPVPGSDDVTKAADSLVGSNLSRLMPQNEATFYVKYKPLNNTQSSQVSVLGGGDRITMGTTSGTTFVFYLNVNSSIIFNKSSGTVNPLQEYTQIVRIKSGDHAGFIDGIKEITSLASEEIRSNTLDQLAFSAVATALNAFFARTAELGIWNIALNDAQCLELHNNGLPTS